MSLSEMMKGLGLYNECVKKNINIFKYMVGDKAEESASPTKFN
jgi:hypothetical protein